MTNAERTLAAVKGFEGKTLKAKDIVALVATQFPEVNVTSILPSDYTVGSKYSTLHIFEKTSEGYRVLETPVRTASPRVRDSRSLTEVAAALRASIAPQTTSGEVSDAELEAMTAPSAQ